VGGFGCWGMGLVLHTKRVVGFVPMSVFMQTHVCMLFAYNSATGHACVSKIFKVAVGFPRDGFRCKNWGHEQGPEIFYFTRDCPAMCHCTQIGHWTLDRM